MALPISDMLSQLRSLCASDPEHQALAGALASAMLQLEIENADLKLQLTAARRRNQELEDLVPLLDSRQYCASAHDGVVSASDEKNLRIINQLEDQIATMVAVNGRLAAANATASESIAELKERDSQLVALNQSLSHANANGAKLVCELQAQAARLQEAVERVRVLNGLISICMHCHKIREESNVWKRLEEYLVKYSDLRFSHGLCPTCLDEHYGEPT